MATAEEKARKMLSHLVGGESVFSYLEKDLRAKPLISGQPLDHWTEKFTVKIPMDNLNPQMIQELSMEVMKLNQEASFYLAAAQAITQCIKRGGDLSYYDVFNEIVQGYREKGEKLPAAATLETMTKMAIKDEESAGFYAEVAAKFWKLILDDLSFCRKTLETASWSLHSEIKLELQQQYAERSGHE